MSDKAGKESQYMVLHPGLDSDQPIGSDRESGCDMGSGGKLLEEQDSLVET